MSSKEKFDTININEGVDEGGFFFSQFILKIYNMINLQQKSVSNLTSSNRKALKWIIFAIVVLVVGIGFWLGFTALKSINKITADSGQKTGILSIFDNKKIAIKGQTEGRTNVLLLGNGGTNHPGGGLTDTMMILSIDWENKKTALISLPRDLWVKIPDYGYSKINYAFYAGNQKPKVSGGGGKVASDVVSEVAGVPIHYYLSLDFEGFKKTVDSLGGVDIYVDKALYDPYYPAADMIRYDPLKITVGLHHMNGDLALKYARSRETTSDFDRSRRQQQVMAAIKEKILSLETLSNPKKITDLLTILGDHLRTNMSIPEIRSLWDEIKTIDMTNMTNKVFDTAPGSVLTSLSGDERGYIIIPKKGIGNYTDVHTIVKNIFTEEKAQTQEKMSIEVLNGTKKQGAATQVSQLLKNYGYNVVSVGNSATMVEDTIVYNCAGSAGEATTKTLTETLDATSKTKYSCGNIDIQVIIGQNNL